MVTSTNQPTNQPTDQQGEYRAICLFRKLENRKKAEICNNFRDKYIEHHLKISDYKNNPNASWTSLKTLFVGKIENWGAQFKFVLIILSFCWLDLNLNIQKIDFSPGGKKTLKKCVKYAIRDEGSTAL